MEQEQPMSKPDVIAYCKYLWNMPGLLYPLAKASDCIEWHKTVFGVPPYPNMNENDVIKKIAELEGEEEEDLYNVFYDDESSYAACLRRHDKD